MDKCKNGDQSERNVKSYQTGCEERQTEICCQLLPTPWLHMELRCIATGIKHFDCLIKTIKNTLIDYQDKTEE